MDVYLPIANLAVNGLVIIAARAWATGILSGIFGVGGGFLTTPLLIFYGIPPTVAAASAATQVTGASVSGVFAHSRNNGVDYQIGLVMRGGRDDWRADRGRAVRAAAVRSARSIVVINMLYVVLLGSIGAVMLKEALQSIGLICSQRRQTRAAKRRHHR